MLNFFIALLVGWPAILVTVILAIMGLAKRDHRFLIGAAILAFPFSWYISGFPFIQSLTFLLPLLPFGSAYALRRDHEMIAWVLSIIYLLTVLLFLFAVLAGNQ